MNIFLSKWKSLAYLGCDEDLSVDNKGIIFLNRFVIAQFIIIVVYAPIEILFLNWKLFPSHIIYGLLSLICLMLNKYKLFTFSKYYFMILMNLHIFYWILEVGGTTETEFFFLASSLFGFLLFKKNLWVVVGQMVISVSLFFLARELTKIISPVVELSDIQAQDIAIMSNIITFILIAIIIIQLIEVWSENEIILNKKNEIIELKNEESSKSMRYAKRIQQAIIPKKEVIDSFVFGSFELTMSKETLSGDFPFYHKQSENVIWLAAADCTGHGVPGSLVSVLGVNILYKAIVEQQLDEPNEILDFATIEMEDSLNRFSEGIVHDGMDICLIRIENIKNQFHISFAGAHNPLWIISNNGDQIDLPNTKHKTLNLNNKSLIEIPGNHLPIGTYFGDKHLFTKHEFIVQKGCRIFLFSDGYSDQFGGVNNKKLTKARFKKLLIENANQPIKDHESILKNYILDWSKDREQIDDILVIGLEL